MQRVSRSTINYFYQWLSIPEWIMYPPVYHAVWLAMAESNTAPLVHNSTLAKVCFATKNSARGGLSFNTKEHPGAAWLCEWLKAPINIAECFAWHPLTCTSINALVSSIDLESHWNAASDEFKARTYVNGADNEVYWKRISCGVRSGAWAHVQSRASYGHLCVSFEFCRAHCTTLVQTYVCWNYTMESVMLWIIFARAKKTNTVMGCMLVYVNINEFNDFVCREL